MNIKCSYKELVKLDDFVEHDKNPNIHTNAQITRLAKLMRSHGIIKPILVSGLSGKIVSGHGRLAAARVNGYEHFPADLIDIKDEAQEYAILVSDNAIADYSKLDLSQIQIDLPDIGPLDDIEDLGILDFKFEPDPEEKEETEKKENQISEDVETVCKPGDLWRLGNHRLLCGDSTNLEDFKKLVGEEKIDIAFSDPPYGIDVVQSNQVGGGGPTKFGKVGGENIVESKTYKKIEGDNSTDTAKRFYELCQAQGIENIVLWGGNYFTDFLYPSRCWIIWDKEMTGNFSQAEMAWTNFKVGGIKIFKYLWNGLSREGNRKDELTSRVHPTQKPVGLFSNIFEKFEDFNNIYDGFGGSGSTLIAAEKVGKKCFMIELDAHYCDIIIDRFEKYSGKKAEKV